MISHSSLIPHLDYNTDPQFLLRLADALVDKPDFMIDLGNTFMTDKHRTRDGAAVPGHARHDNTRSAEEYGYKSGTVFGSSGHLRVRMEPTKTTVDYVRSYLPADKNGTRKNGAVSFSYELKPR